MFYIRQLKTPSKGFNINNYVSFSSSNTRSSTHIKLKNTSSQEKNNIGHFYFIACRNSGTCFYYQIWIRFQIHCIASCSIPVAFHLNFQSNFPCSFHLLDCVPNANISPTLSMAAYRSYRHAFSSASLLSYLLFIRSALNHSKSNK